MLNTVDNKVKDLINIDIQKCPSIIYATQYEQGFAKYLPFVLKKSTIVGRYLQSYKYFVKMPVIKESDAGLNPKKCVAFLLTKKPKKYITRGKTQNKKTFRGQ